MSQCSKVRRKYLCDKVVAIDNSPVQGVSLQQHIEAAGIDILSNFNRGGVAGAYNSGLRCLIEKECQLLFMFDQDSLIQDDYFQHMRDRCLTLDSKHFLLGPKIFDINANRYLHKRVNCVITARLHGNIAAENVEPALEQIQRKHPHLRARVIEENGQPYFLFTECPAKIHLRVSEARIPTSLLALLPSARQEV